MISSRLVAAVLTAIIAVAPARADQVLGPGRIDNSGRVVLPGGPVLGTYAGGKYIAKPDAIELQGSGSKGNVSGMNVSLHGGATGFLGQVLPALDIARSEIASQIIPLRTFTASGFVTAGDGGAGARYVRGTSSGYMAIQDAAGTWWQLDLSSADIPAGWVGVVAGDSTKDVSNASAINGLMTALAARGGGRVRLPAGNVFVGATLDNAYDYVLVEGKGEPFAAYGSPAYATTLVPTFAGTVFKHRTPAGSSHINNGGGLVGVRIIGNARATRLLEVDTVWNGRYKARLEDSVGSEAAYFMGGELAAISGVCIQHADIDLSVSQVADGAASSADAVVFDGGPNSNVSINERVKLDILHKNGDGLVLRNADNNIIWQRTYRVPGGTGAAVRSKGAASEAISARANYWKFLTTNAPSIFEGTETATYPSKSNIIQVLDKDNGTPMPQVGAGAQAYVLNGRTNYTPTITAGSGSLGSGVSAAGTWTQDASGKVTAFVTITLPNASGASGYIGVSLPIPPRNGAIEGSVTGKELSLTGKGVAGIVNGSLATFQYYDGSFAGANGLNFRLKLEYQG